MTQSLSDCAWAMMALSMLSAMEEMGKEFIRPELEKRLGHPANELDWWWYEREKASKAGQAFMNNKVQLVSWEELVAPFQQLARDFEIIHSFIWEQVKW